MWLRCVQDSRRLKTEAANLQFILVNPPVCSDYDCILGQHINVSKGMRENYPAKFDLLNPWASEFAKIIIILTLEVTCMQS